MKSYDFFIYEFICFMNSNMNFGCIKVPDVHRQNHRTVKQTRFQPGLPLTGPQAGRGHGCGDGGVTHPRAAGG